MLHLMPTRYGECTQAVNAKAARPPYRIHYIRPTLNSSFLEEFNEANGFQILLCIAMTIHTHLTLWIIAAILRIRG